MKTHPGMRKLLLLLFIFVILAIVGRQLQIQLDSRPTGASGPWLQHGESSSMHIHWHSEQATVSTASLYAPGSEKAIQTAEVPGNRRKHRVSFAGLQPATRYEYSTDQSLQRYSFHTPPATVDAVIRMWVLGDPGVYGDIARSVHASATQWMRKNPHHDRGNAELLLTSGDNAYTSGRYQEYITALLKPLQQQLAGTSFWPAYGNHDARRRAFFKLFTFPADGESGGLPSRSQRYYSFNYGPAHVVMLDSQSSLRWRKAAMLKWLELDLQQNRLPWTIVVMHHPPYSKGSNDSDAASGSDWRQRIVREQIAPLLDQEKVNLVISGHSHSYERSHLLAGHYDTSDTLLEDMLVQSGQGPGDVFLRDPGCKSDCGTVYVVLGSSSKIDQAPLNHPAMAVAAPVAGSLVLDVNPDCMITRMIGTQQQTIDAFMLLDETASTQQTKHDCQL